MTQKQILINQIITDVMGLDDSGQEKEIGLILNKLQNLSELEKIETEKAEKDDAMEGNIPPEENESRDDSSIY